jgi:ribosomal protein S18 acetylase RimI-like enzyme
LRLRPATDADREFLLAVYGAVREAELSQVQWPEGAKEAFVAQQFDAQDRYYREYYANATFDVIEVDGRPAGRLYVDRWPAEIRIVDIALAAEFRGGGVGTALLRELIAEAETSGRSLTIHVEQGNPARRLYERLGFVPVAERGHNTLMSAGPPLREGATYEMTAS